MSGATGGGHDQFRQLCDYAPRFTADTADKSGGSERVVQLNAERGTKIIPHALQLLRGTADSKGRVLARGYGS